MTLFELIAKLVMDTEDFSSEAEAANKTGEELGDSLEKTMAKGVAMGNAIYDGVKKSINVLGGFASEVVAAASAEEIASHRFATVFGKDAAEVQWYLEEYGKIVGIHYTTLRNEASSLYTQFLASGMEADKASYMMVWGLQAAADAAAAYDITLNDASYKLRSFLRGNVEAGESIGLFTSQTVRNEKAAELLGLRWEELNELQKEIVLSHIVDDIYNQAKVFGTAEAEAGEYANRLAYLKDSWTQIRAVLGGPIIEEITPVFDKMAKFLSSDEGMKLAKNFAEAFGAIASAIADSLLFLIEFISENSDTITGFIKSFTSGSNGILQLVSSTIGFISNPETGLENVVEAGVSVVDEIPKMVYIDPIAPDEVDKRIQELYEKIEKRDGTSSNGFLDSGKRGTFELSPGITAKAPNDQNAENEGLLAAFREVGGEIIGSLSGLQIVMDGTVVGNLVTPTVSANMARDARGKLNTSGRSFGSIG